MRNVTRPTCSKAIVLFATAAIAGTACLIAYRWIGATVDSKGFLQEPFALLPIGYLLIALGLLGMFGLGIFRLGKWAIERKLNMHGRTKP